VTTAFLERSIGEIAREAGGGDLVSITVPAPVVHVDKLLDLPLGKHPFTPILFWAPPAGQSRASFSYAGFGEVVRIEADGPRRLAAVRERGEQLLRALRERVHPGCAAVPPSCLFGGIAFRPERQRTAPWSSFRDASFSLPRWLYGCSDGAAFLRLSLRAEELSDSIRIVDEADRIGASIMAAACAEPSPARDDACGQGPDQGTIAPPDSRIEAMSSAEFCALVEHALSSIRSKALEKVVPIAWSHVTPAGPVDVAAALRRMGHAYADCVRFAVQRGETTFAGASPERLVTLHGRSLEADALAGTVRRGQAQEDDAALVRSLCESDKDRREHAIVVQAIAGVLAPICERLRIPPEPKIRSLRNVHHLWTPIRGELRTQTHILDLVAALHPTPAVCGTPREAAFDWISRHERVSRGWYTGAVGFFDAMGDGAFSVAIRAGLLEMHDAWLYAGAGIVEGSNPLLEYAETRAKQSPMLAALGLLP
jgi:isochorismate synthase